MLAVAASNTMINAGLTVFDEALLTEFGWSLRELKLRDTINFLGAAILVLGVGALVDRVGFKPPLMFGLAVLAVVYFSYSFISNLMHVYALHVLLAMVLASAGNMVGIIGAVSLMPERRGLAVGLTLAGSSIGGVILPPLATAMIEENGWRQAMQQEALIPVVILILVGMLLHNRIAGREKSTADQAQSHQGMDYQAAIRTRQFIFIAIAAGLTFFCVVAVASHLFLYMRSLEFSARSASLALSLYSLVGLAGKLFTGWLSDHLSPFTLMRTNMLVMLIGLIGLFYLPVYIWLFVAITAFGWGGLHTLYNYILLALFGMRAAGKINATVSLMQSAGAGFGAAATGWLFDLRGDYSLAFIVILALMVAGCLLTLGIRPLKMPVAS